DDLVNPLDLLSGWRLRPKPAPPPVSDDRWKAIAALRLSDHNEIAASSRAFRKARAGSRRSELKALRNALKPHLPVNFDKAAWYLEPRFKARGRKVSLQEAIHDLPDYKWRRIQPELHAVALMLTLEGPPE